VLPEAPTEVYHHLFGS